MKNRLMQFYTQKLRKNTVVVHWLYGFLCAYIAMKYFPASLAMMGLFAGLERWNDLCDNTNEGCTDWWDSVVTYSAGLVVILILEGIGLVAIRWI